MINPMQYAIHKGKGGSWGCAQFNLKLPELKSGAKYPNEGCVFINITSATAPDVYDWANKIVMALSVTDLGKMLLCLRTGSECKIIHDPGAGTETAGQINKNLYMASPKGIENGCMLTVRQKDNNGEKKHTVPLTVDEVAVLGTLVSTAIFRCLNW